MKESQNNLILILEANLAQIILDFLEINNPESYLDIKEYLLSLSENNADLISEISDEIISLNDNLDFKETFDLIIKNYFPE